MHLGKKSLLVTSTLTLMTVFVYFVFRIFVLRDTLAISINAIDTVLIVAFYVGEMFILLHAGGYFYSIMRALMRYTRPDLYYAGESTPKVTVCIPARDEPLGIVKRTLIACSFLDYPNFEIILLDGSDKQVNRDAYKQLCEDYQFTYYAVPEPKHGAKAGAINDCLRDVIRSHFIAVFDADFRPSRDFLKTLVAQITETPHVAFIQTPQFYGNIDTSVVSRAAELQQSIFYEYLCEAKSAHDGLFMCGTNLLIRTSALREVGGFDETSITEDFATSLLLMRAGWVGRYYNYTAAFGDGPVNLREYFRQQYRWARGTLDLFFKNLPYILWRRGLTVGQRWEFLLSGSYYLVGLCWFVLVMLPPLYVFFRIPLYAANPYAYLLAYVPYFAMTGFLFFQTLMSRQYRAIDWLRAESLTLLAVPIYAKAAIDTLLRNRTSFQTTRKNASRFEIPWDMFGAQVFLIVINLAAFLLGVWYLSQGSLDLPLAINTFWSAFHGFFLAFIPLEVYANARRSRTR
ncbi:hypothetical protein COV06_00415 [Candidatus Uhrbacteria bacterium CG10_big_fil_rev_8_21_14_0_10_50_16]|uniref:Glycosyltransferase 2-like domain-containing protein n=1 Tax=Candidatus Uhrbacteria bacterium CG10_big_fil_rev_8_21_14_0_10_50_16 TaxID=1975039 RepID=A0A2H0RMT3_9BACT|nr:MAG: hypothetical protein COV06_00415 [Candidatus Uhrbacteria bacterium CG10_big_fil_rev_8_21_14_0_10_50_16]